MLHFGNMNIMIQAEERTGELFWIDFGRMIPYAEQNWYNSVERAMEADRTV